MSVTDLWDIDDLDDEPKRPWRELARELMGDAIREIRGWHYTRRQVAILGFVILGGFVFAAGVAIFTAILVIFVGPFVL